MTETVETRTPVVPEFVQRVVRQLVQTYGPVIIVVLTAPNVTNDLAAVAVAVGAVIVATTLKLLSRVKTTGADPWWLIVLDRAGSAAAAVIIGTGVSDLAGLLTIDWVEVGGAAVLAAVAALLMLFYVPPVLPPVLPPVHEGGEDGTGLADTPADGVPAPTPLPRRDPGSTLGGGTYPPAV
jgi:hypothetical protein